MSEARGGNHQHSGVGMSGDVFSRLRALTPQQRARLRATVNPDTGGAPHRRERPDGTAPASYTQEQLWFLDRLSPGGPSAYLVPFALRLRGPLDVEALRAALAGVVARHEVLRSHFCLRDGELRQVIRPAVVVPMPVEVVGDAVWSRATELAAERFELTEGPLVRTALLRAGEHDHVLVWIAHHAVADGFSVRVLVDELAAGYRAASAGERPELSPLPVQYADVAEWQRERLTGDRLDALLDHWRAHLAGAPAAVLPPDRPRPPVLSFHGDCVPCVFPGELAAGVADLAAACGTTVFVVAFAALAAVLARYSGEPDAVIGAALSGRQRAELDGMIGPFATTVPLRVDAGGGGTFRELVERVSRVVLDGMTHQEVPFGELVRGLGQARDASRNPLYQVLFSMDALDAVAPQRFADRLTVAVSGLPNGTARLDLQLTLRHGAGVLDGRLDYNTDLYDQDTAASVVRAFGTFLAGAVQDPDRPLETVSLLDAASRERVLARWRVPAPAGPVTGFLEAFTARVAAEPDRVALVSGSFSATYRELDRLANRVAHAVRARGCGRGAVVAVGVERTPMLLPVLLGVLKSGAAYLPLDPTFPADRLAFMLADSGAALLVREPGTLDWVTVETLDAVPDGPDHPVADGPEPADLAYVMYTSGSTGTPKGVAVRHHALANFLCAMSGLGLVRREDTIVALTNTTFDISLDELLLPLTVGATVVLATRPEARDGRRLRELLAEHAVTVLHGTPATCRLLVESGWAGPPVRRVLCGGEAMSAKLAAELTDRAPEVWNLFGPTEATVWSLVHRVAGDGPPPIGRPLAGTTAYVLDASLRPVPPGVLGELYLGGAGLAEGYLNRPDLTAERFGTDGSGVRLYRTGDLATYRPDGVFCFHGRVDHQVKLRGFRIELGEIEAALTRQTRVTEAVAMVVDAGEDDRRLVAFVRTSSQVTETELRSELHRSLPTHMVPSRIVALAEFPLTPSGKVDRKALAARPVEDVVVAHVAPGTETERWVADRWAGLLGRARIGLHDNFFSIGGHSLLAVRVLAEVWDVYGVDVPVDRFFTTPTVAGLATLVTESLTESDDALLNRIEGLSDAEVARLLDEAA